MHEHIDLLPYDQRSLIICKAHECLFQVRNHPGRQTEITYHQKYTHYQLKIKDTSDGQLLSTRRLVFHLYKTFKATTQPRKGYQKRKKESQK